MDKAIVTVLLIICGVVATMTIFNEVLPAISRSQGAISVAADNASDVMTSRIEIIQTTAVGSVVNIWVKNVGATTIGSISNCSVIFGVPDNAVPIGYGGSTTPRWTFALTGSHEQWSPTVDLCVSIDLAAPLSNGVYLVRVVIPNGVSDETSLSVG
jgi:hypothetical protein